MIFHIRSGDDMFEGLELLIKLVNQLLDNNEKCHKEEFKFYIEDVYKMSEEIYMDFVKTLNTAYELIKLQEMSIDEVLLYFNDSRLPFRSSRAKIRGIIKHPDYYRNEAAFWFAIGAVGILEGGLHDSTERFLRANLQENDFSSDNRVYLKGNHTIVDIIRRYDRNNHNSLFFSDFFNHYLGEKEKDEAIKESLLRDIKRQIRKLDESWTLMCEYYPLLVFE